jgi:glutamyl-tRNA reductase
MLFVTGLNHTTASVSLRERLAVRESEVAGLTSELRSQRGVEEVVVLSTCNRVEVYASGSQPESLLEILDRRFGLGEETMRLYRHTDQEAARHLFRVVSGLDSMVLGETEIFGQVKSAYAAAQKAGATARVLNKLFQHAFRVGKHVRSSTQIQQGATSVGGAAVELAEKIFGDLRDSTVMVLGAGEISRRTAQSLQSRGACSLIVANRTHERAVELASEMGGRAAARRRHGRPLFLIDIAVPRDIDPACGELDDVYLYNIDHLEQMASEARGRREFEIARCESLIAAEVAIAAELLLPASATSTGGSAAIVSAVAPRS